MQDLVKILHYNYLQGFSRDVYLSTSISYSYTALEILLLAIMQSIDDQSPAIGAVILNNAQLACILYRSHRGRLNCSYRYLTINTDNKRTYNEQVSYR